MYTNIYILPYELGNPINLALIDLYKFSCFPAVFEKPKCVPIILCEAYR